MCILIPLRFQYEPLQNSNINLFKILHDIPMSSMLVFFIRIELDLYGKGECHVSFFLFSCVRTSTIIPNSKFYNRFLNERGPQRVWYNGRSRNTIKQKETDMALTFPI